MYSQSSDHLSPRPIESSNFVVAPVAAPVKPPAPRTGRPRRKQRPLPGAALLARMAGDPAAAPDWLKFAAAELEAAGRPDRPLAARVADVNDLLSHLDRVYATRLPEVQQWFDSPHAAGRSLPSTLPVWTETLLAEAGALIGGRMLPELAAAGIDIRPVVQLDEGQRAWLHRYFMRQVYPLLTPLAVDSGRPFPYISSDSLNLLVELRRPEAAREDRALLFARVKVPPSTPRLVAVPTQVARFPSGDEPHLETKRYVSSADLVRFFVHHLFTGMPVRHVYFFRVVRGETPLPGAGRRAARRHRRQQDQPVVRLDVERRMAEPVLRWLMEHLHVPAHGVAHHENLLEPVCLPEVARILDEGATSR